MVSFHGSNFTLASLVGVDVQGVEIFAHVVQRLELGIHIGADVSLYTKIQKPRP